MIRLNAGQLRKYQISNVKYPISRLKRKEIYIILDNVLDTYNIGSIFRLADAIAAKKIYLCGGTETPPNHRIKKASINTTEWVEWEYCASAAEAIKKLKFSTSVEQKKARIEQKKARTEQKHSSSSEMGFASREIQIVAVEQAKNSVPYDKFDYKLPLALVVGHESNGVSPEVLKLCDAIVELPMFGVNISLNVMVSLGIVLYQAIEKSAKT